MKMILTVADYERKPCTKNRMIYTDENGGKFDGPEMNVMSGESYWIEVSHKDPDDVYWYIMKFISGPKNLGGKGRSA